MEIKESEGRVIKIVPITTKYHENAMGNYRKSIQSIKIQGNPLKSTRNERKCLENCTKSQKCLDIVVNIIAYPRKNSQNDCEKVNK